MSLLQQGNVYGVNIFSNKETIIVLYRGWRICFVTFPPDGSPLWETVLQLFWISENSCHVLYHKSSFQGLNFILPLCSERHFYFSCLHWHLTLLPFLASLLQSSTLSSFCLLTHLLSTATISCWNPLLSLCFHTGLRERENEGGRRRDVERCRGSDNSSVFVVSISTYTLHFHCGRKDVICIHCS